MIRHDRILELLPSAGFFGASDFNCMVLHVGDLISSLHIEIDRGMAAEFLNVGAIKIFSNEGQYNKSDIIHSVNVSSSYDRPEEEITQCVINEETVHTKFDSHPFLEIFFNKKIQISKIMIFNRWDIFWARSRRLVVFAKNENRIVFNFINFDPELLYSKFLYTEAIIENFISRYARSCEGEALLKNYALVDRLMLGDVNRNRMLKILIDKCVRDRNLSIATLPAGIPIELLDMGVYEDLEKLNLDLSILSVYVAQILIQAGQFETHALAPFAQLLSSQAILNKFMWHLNTIPEIEEKYKSSLILSKHSIHSSELIANKEQYLSALNQLIFEFRLLDLEIFICYGTLLGAVRSGSFIEHDDDVDIVYIDRNSLNYDEALAKSRLIEAELRNRGYLSWRGGAALHFNVSRDVPPIDVFPLWLIDSSAYLMMENFNIRAIPSNIILPLGNINMYGSSFPAPRDPAAFLAERYGKDWHTPNKFHEWPWEISII